MRQARHPGVNKKLCGQSAGWQPGVRSLLLEPLKLINLLVRLLFAQKTQNQNPQTDHLTPRWVFSFLPSSPFILTSSSCCTSSSSSFSSSSSGICCHSLLSTHSASCRPRPRLMQVMRRHRGQPTVRRLPCVCDMVSRHGWQKACLQWRRRGILSERV